jgi:hypothetical protein
MPRVNWFIFGAYLLLTLSVFAGVLAFPPFRANGWLSYAPLRELVLPPPPPIEISLLYSTEKEAWLNEVVSRLEAEGVRVEGRPLKIKLEKLGSREVVLAVVNGEAQPDLISPASSLQLSILTDLSSSRFGTSVINQADTALCRPVLRTPLVIAAWKERADVLWGATPSSNMWLSLHDTMLSPQGWAALGHPEWGFIKYGQTDPLRSNSGFMAVLLMTYNYFGKTSGLSGQDLLNDVGFQQWFAEFQGNAVTPFSQSTGPLMQDMIAIGPSRYDFVAVYEATAIEQAENAVGRYGELRVYYPPATVVSDHPFCALRQTAATPWVTPEKTRAVQVFLDYLTAQPAQELALLKHGYRPVNAAVSLTMPGSPLSQYATNGFRADLPPEVEVPSGNVLNTLLDLWSRVTSR